MKNYFNFTWSIVAPVISIEVLIKFSEENVEQKSKYLQFITSDNTNVTVKPVNDGIFSGNRLSQVPSYFYDI